MILAPLRRRLGPGARRRRDRKLARRREAGKVPAAVATVDPEAERAKAARIRKRLAEAVRRRHDDPVEAARVIRMLGLPRRVPKPRKKKAAA